MLRDTKSHARFGQVIPLRIPAIIPNVPLEAAIAYKNHGFPVFRLTPGTKIPVAGSNGVYDATLDEGVIRAWFAELPTANLAIALGEGRLVIDVDDKHGNDGFATLAGLVAEHGPLPLTAAQKTPSGRGLHFLYRVSANGEFVGTLGPGIDVLHAGRYIVVEPSVIVPSERELGGRYTWCRP
jgi:hypothetical protein